MQKLAEEGASPEKLRLALEEFEKAMSKGMDVERMAKNYAQVDFYGSDITMNNPRLEKDTSTSAMDNCGPPSTAGGENTRSQSAMQASKVAPLYVPPGD